MNGLVGTIELDILRTLNLAHTSCMSPFSVFFILWYSGVHVYSMHCGNKASYVEMLVNDYLGFGAILHIPNVDSYDGHVRLWRDLDNSGFGG